MARSEDKQTVCYPSQAVAQGSVPPKPDHPTICTKCNAVAKYQNDSCCASNGSHNGMTNKAPCTSYCNTNCNTVCDTIQAYCSINHEDIKSHGNVNEHPKITLTDPKDPCDSPNIIKAWKATYWNSLIKKIDTAEIVGLTQSQGKGVTADQAVSDKDCSHPAGSLVTAEKYNQIINKLNRFRISLPNVDRCQVIKKTHAENFVNGYNDAKFNTNVCDTCNASGQTYPNCSCNCPCSCGCPCGCSCSCDCSCSCTCGSSGSH